MNPTGKTVGDSILKAVPDSISSVLTPDSLILPGDSLVIDPATMAAEKRQKRRDSLQKVFQEKTDFKSKVIYTAEDSSVLDVPNDILYLYGNATVNFESISLTAERIWIEFNSQTVHADGFQDSLGNWEGTPEFKEGDQMYLAKSIRYNFKTEKGMVTGGRTTQGENILLSDKVKKQPDQSYHLKGGKYTTCNHEDPHYYIKLSKAKILPNKQVISGPLNLVIEDFPIPIYIPFGFIPNTPEKKRNGIKLPQYGESERGFFLRNLGYYRGLGPYFDLLVDGDIFTKGGWRLGARTRYNKKYKYNGSLSMDYGVTRFGEKTNEFTDPNYQKTTGFSINWRHTQPINPTTRFNASVNISTRSFLKEISFNPEDVFTNTLASSINFSKSFAPFNLSVNMGHRQESGNNTLNLNLPTLTLNMARQQPFKNVRGKGLDWLRQIGFTYNAQATNTYNSVPDSLLLDVIFNPTEDLVIIDPDDITDTTIVNASTYSRNGIQQRSSLSTNLKLANYINIVPSFNFRERWYFESMKRVWNSAEDKTEDITVPGFVAAHEYDFSVSANTTLYGLYGLKNSKKKIVVRQQIIPSIGYSINPDFSDPKYGYYREVQTNREGDTELYNRLQGATYGSPSPNESQSMTFGLNNVFEMKYLKKQDPDKEYDPDAEEEFERIRILDGLGINGSYNFAADSLRLSNFSISARTSLFKRKLNITSNATLDPYALTFKDEDDDAGSRFNTLEWIENRRVGRITNARISMSTNFRSKQTKAKTKSNEFDDEELSMIQDNFYEYVDFDIPWSVRLSYNLQYSKPNARAATLTNVVRATGDLNLTEKWKIGYSTGYDFTRKEVTQTRFTVYRDLHCWELAFDVVPFGSLQSYTLTINVRSSTLRDLRVQKRDQWQDRSRNF
ncbi:putative LPS assembly protein LptD [bacterium]|nr:putative LPS assembly protein LptD [bacterium]